MSGDATRKGGWTADDSADGMRLDGWLARQDPSTSRSRWQQWIRDGFVRVDGQPCKPNHQMRAGECVAFCAPDPAPVPLHPENISLDILFEDADVLVLNKPAGMVAHPAPGHEDGTLVNALLHHCGDLGGIGGELRPGIVHRLDQNTTGVMVIAKRDGALQALADQFKARQVSKEYLALVAGQFQPPDGIISAPIGRHPRHRKKMAVEPVHGRPALTRYFTEERLGPFSLVRLKIETGRTHQIRVHMAHAGHAILGDPVYGHAAREIGPVRLGRQMLHAKILEFLHPRTGERLRFEAPLPPDFQQALAAARELYG